MSTKKCTKCGIEKERGEFHKRSGRKCGLQSRCKKCTIIYQENHKSETNARAALFYVNNKDSILNRNKKRYEDKKQEILAQYATYKKQKYKTDINYRLCVILRSRLRNALLYNSKKAGSAVKDLGCTNIEFKNYIESLFKPGMSWDNYGKNGWHIDHIKPLASFDLSNREELLKAVHYTNQQPLWAKDNISKGAKLDWKK